MIPRQTFASGQPASDPSEDPETAERHRLAQQAMLDEMRERDRRDRERAESPLRPAADAEILDSTAMTLEEVLARAEEIVLTHVPLQ